MSQTKQAKLSIETWRQVKIQSAREDLTMMEILEKAVGVYLAQQHAHTSPVARKDVKQAPQTLKKTIQIAQELHSLGQHQIVRGRIEEAIMRVAGGDARTIQKYLGMLVRWEVLVPTVHPTIWTMNHEGGWLPYHLDP